MENADEGLVLKQLVVSLRSKAFAFSLASFMESLAAFLKTVPVSLE